MWKPILGIALAALTLTGQAQEYYMSEPSVSACQGAFLDSGGNGGGYGDNENFTTVICPDGSGPAISLQWIIFNLSTAGTAPLDQLSIYDGDNTSAQLIGTWSGSDSPGIISASFANSTGCLTLVFTSNGNGVGDFAAAMSCFQPCEPPTAVATAGGPVPILVCQDEVITFDASASFAAAGFNVDQFIWDFADGSVDSTSGAVVTHSFSDPAEYVVQVTVVDDNDCASTNLVDLQFLVSTTPLFVGTSGDVTICQGTSTDLTAVPNAVTWSALPESNL
ncbi:MAG: PKD domain-containing protein, partial [Flavobacteriales bacterium]|nr:PKD domain-containing protein [Flavobacteriales bacterium]